MHDPNEPEWIVNDLGELGVKVGDRFYFLYKGRSLEYGAPNATEAVGWRGPLAVHGDGTPMRYRRVGKREFGEVCWPLSWVQRGYRDARYAEELVNPSNPLQRGTADESWRDLPASPEARRHYG